MSTSPAPRIPLTRSAAARIADASRRIDMARTYRRVCSISSASTIKFDHTYPIGPQVSSERAFAAFVAGCTCTLTSHKHTAECDARWTAAAEAAEVEMAAAPVFEVGQRVRFTDDIGTPELVHVTGVITEAGPRESVVTLDTRVPGYSAELRSFNRYIELLSDAPAELTAVEAVRLVTRRSQAIAADKADRRAAHRGGIYRAELRAYGVPVEALLYAEPAGPGSDAGRLDWLMADESPVATVRAPWVSDETAAALDAAQAEVPTKAQLSAAEYAAALRTLADIVEATPEVHRYNDFYVWYGGSRADLATVTRAALAAGVKVEKDIDESSYNVDLRIGPLKVSALSSRRNVCERVVLGTDEVTKSVPDPTYVAPEVPLVEVTETVERIEWRCTPLLAEGGE